MKTIINILIICFVAITIYAVKDDLKTAYDKAQTFISGMQPSKNSQLEQNKNTSIPYVEHATVGTALSKLVSTPGPLRSFAKKVASQASDQALTLSGIISETNKARVQNGALPALIENTTLDISAKRKLDDLFAKQYFEHISPDGIHLTDIANTVGYEYLLIGENLALGDFTSSADVVAAWMASPGHRANILNTSYTQIGVAVRKGVYEGKETWIAVQHFGLPISVCPPINKTLKFTISVDQQQIDLLQTDLDAKKKEIDASDPSYKSDYNQKVDAYNAEVSDYNALSLKIKEEIDTYNTSVRTFNACITEYTGK